MANGYLPPMNNIGWEAVLLIYVAILLSLHVFANVGHC